MIYPTGEEWKDAPEIEEGATVHKDQTLLLMPDLTQMQVKVGIHESIVDRIHPGMKATVTLPDRELEGEVVSVAEVTRPAGWWTGNVVKYDTIIKLPSVDGLKPGMTAGVEILMASHRDVLTVPAAAVVETAEGDFCWVKTGDKIQKRKLRLGDTDDVFVMVLNGLKTGDQVVMDPMNSVEEAQNVVLKPIEENDTRELMRDQPARGAGESTPQAEPTGEDAESVG